MNKRLYILYCFIRFFNAFLSDVGYRLGHFLLAMLISLRYETIIFQCAHILCHMLALELIAETIVFPRSKRRKYYEMGTELIEEIREELNRSD